MLSVFFGGDNGFVVYTRTKFSSLLAKCLVGFE